MLYINGSKPVQSCIKSIICSADPMQVSLAWRAVVGHAAVAGSDVGGNMVWDVNHRKPAYSRGVCEAEASTCCRA